VVLILAGMRNLSLINPHICDLSKVQSGDRLEARRNGVTHYFGQVDHTVPDYGIVWIIEGVGGTRKLLYQDEYDLWRSTH
jgi:hypothetical protein